MYVEVEKMEPGWPLHPSWDGVFGWTGQWADLGTRVAHGWALRALNRLLFQTSHLHIPRVPVRMVSGWGKDQGNIVR